MTGRMTVITPPTLEPVALAEALQHCHADSGVEDSYIQNILIPAARQKAEDYQNRAYLSQTIKLVFDSYPESTILLPFSPVISISSIKYFDTANTEATFSSSYYSTDLNSDPARIYLKDGYTWPTTTLRPQSGFEVNYVAGYGATAASVPAKVKMAILFLVGFWYENRGMAEELPEAFYNVLRPTRLKMPC